MTISDRIKIRREELGITQDELASKLGLKDKSSISQIENMGDDVTMKNVIRIATALSTTPRYLMGYEEAPVEETQYTTLNQIYHVLKRDKEFDDRAIPVVFGYENEADMVNQIKKFGPILIPYSRVKEVASIYDLSPEYLMGLTTERRKVTVNDEEMTIEIKQIPSVHNPNLQEELSLVKAYREASEELKGAVMRILNVDTSVLSASNPGVFHQQITPKKVTKPLKIARKA